MEMESMVQFLENKSILVTGATGYLAKVFVEKILRVQPNVKKLYLLLRAADQKSAMERLQNEVVRKDLFKVLKEKHGASALNFLVSEKITPIPGDISLENLGVKDFSLKDEMWREVEVIVNFAATTKFDERYDVALSINALGALHVLNFAKKCINIKIVVHVSTAYVCGEDTGIIIEKPFKMGEGKRGTNKIDIDSEKTLVQDKLQELQSKSVTENEITSAMKYLGIERARLYGWPNTYVFTKAMGEMLFLHCRENMPVVVLRPTMITGTYKEPFPGWIEGLRTLDGVVVAYAKGKMKCFIYNPQTTLDLIPSDMVVNALIVAMKAHANKACSEIIYHVGSSLRNPVKPLDIHDFVFRYFTKNPWISKDGSPVKLEKGRILSNITSFYIYMAINFILPLKALYLVNTMLFQKYHDTCADLDRKLKLVMKLVDLYKPYLLFEGLFDDTNTQNLRIAAKNCPDADVFNFDPRCIDWEAYMMTVHIPGLIKYVVK